MKAGDSKKQISDESLDYPDVPDTKRDVDFDMEGLDPATKKAIAERQKELSENRSDEQS